MPADAPAPARLLPPSTRVYAIGDIHGCDDLLATIHAGILDDAARARESRRVVVYLGDYVSRGSASRDVLERILDWRPAGFEIVTLKGNHEDLLLRFLAGELETGDHWFDFGGLETLASYGIDVDERLPRSDATLERLRLAMIAALPDTHIAFLADLRVHHSEGGYRFVHAGVVPGIPLVAQTEHEQIWIRRAFTESDRDHGAVIVHGHCISPRPQLRHNRIGIDTGAFRTGTLTCLVLAGARPELLQT